MHWDGICGIHTNIGTYLLCGLFSRVILFSPPHGHFYGECKMHTSSSCHVGDFKKIYMLYLDMLVQLVKISACLYHRLLSVCMA